MNDFNDRLIPQNQNAHIVLPKNSVSLNVAANSHNSIISAYPHGIAFIDQLGAMEGYLTIIGSALFLSVFSIFIYDIEDAGFNFSTLWSISMIIISMQIIRYDTIAYRYQPVLFDNASGRVHAFIDEGVTWWKIWQWKPMSRIDTWEWSCTRAEVVEFLVVTGGGAPRRECGLVGAITESPDSLKVVSRFGIGLTSSYDNGAMMQRWEHIRLFMSGRGPHLSAGDSMFSDESTDRLIAAIFFGQPLLGPGSKIYWTGEAINGAWFFTIPAGIFFLILLPLTMPAGLLRYLSHAVKREPKWPEAVLASVGGNKLTNAEILVMQSQSIDGGGSGQ